jgi:hypothetical protein
MVKKIPATELDAKADRGDSIVEYLDLATARRPGLSVQRVNVDFPLWEVQALDREARRLGIPRQALIKVWIAERLDNLQGRRQAGESSHGILMAAED